MKKITKFTKANLPTVRKEITDKLAELKALGLDINIGNISFNDDSFTTKMTVKLENARSEYEVEYLRNWESKEFPNAVGKSVTFQGETFIFKGFKPRARVRQAVIENARGSYRVEFNSINSQLK